MLNFTTNAARRIANKQTHTSLDVAKNMAEYLNTDASAELSDKTNMLELFLIGETAARHGAYQVSYDLFADLQFNLYLNKYGIWAVRVPGLNSVTFHLSDGQWKTRTKNIEVVKDFLKKVLADENNYKLLLVA